MLSQAWALEFQQEPAQQISHPTLGRQVLALGTKLGEQGCGKEGVHCQECAWFSLAAS